MSLIKQLRERTSAPIKDVKASLVDCNWDIEAAQKELKERGKVLAMKKSSRTATEGLLALAQNEGKAAVIELNCETDFVAKNEIFEYLALALAKQALLVENSSQQVHGVFSFGPECLEDLKLNLDHPKISGETTIQNAVTEVAAMMGENIKLRRGVVMSTSSPGVVSAYLHRCPPQAESTGKSQMVIDKMVEGHLSKYFEEVVRMEQKYFLNDSLSIKVMLDNLSKEVGSPVKIGNFFRMEVGEGIQRGLCLYQPLSITLANTGVPHYLAKVDMNNSSPSSKLQTSFLGVKQSKLPVLPQRPSIFSSVGQNKT
ncbi:Elongation factor Ts [Hibiscus syriacus]|uniref:Elongation factor Ts, mitochondrial n=1 Tax=Hibiscus syriacus TaxID=106335 RepID=A0A6A3D810_HIBSY|nr:Elongation factor Ts [Hibiscus syriacus]